ncbi:MAG: 7-carboxy-7-deazaguanine synthase QueE [Candidatus Hadarchaeales archaeon]
MLEVTEVFKSIMGEGAYVGATAVFVRFSRCNLRCSFCDTKYSWGCGRLVEVKELIHEIEKLLPAELVVLTGGEPLLQDSKEILELCRELRPEKLLIETNGTVAPSRELVDAIDVWSISPKLKNSEQVVDYGDFEWVKHAKEWYFKFVVVRPEEDVPEVERFIARRMVSPSRVFLQPANISGGDYIGRAKTLADYCLKRGLTFRVVPQLHVILGMK